MAASEQEFGAALVALLETDSRARMSPCGLILAVLAVSTLGCARLADPGDGRSEDAGSSVRPAAVAPSSESSARAALTRADRDAWRARLRWPDDCEQAFEATDASGDAGLTVHALTDGSMLVEVRCAAGAYQPSSLFIRVDGTRSPPAATVLTFATYGSPDGETIERADSTELWGEPAFLPQHQQLTLLSLARQTGDCGTWTEYTLADGMPMFVALYARLPCPSTPEAPVNPAPGRPPEGWKAIDVQ